MIFNPFTRLLIFAGLIAITILRGERFSVSSFTSEQKTFLAGSQPNVMMSQSTSSPVEIRFSDKFLQRPPLVTLFFTVKLRNDHAKPVWFILPSKLNLPTEPLKNGVDGVEVFQLKGQGLVIVGKFQGTGGFQALRLPPKAEITLQRFPIAFWGTLSQERISIPVILAQTLNIGGEPAQAWFGNDPLSDHRATVSFAQATTLSNRYTNDRSEVPVSVTGERHIKLEVELR